LSKRAAYFSDISGALIDGDRVRLRIKRPDGSTTTLDGSREELKEIKTPRGKVSLVTVGLSYPDGRSKPVTFQVPESELSSVLPQEVYEAVANGNRRQTRQAAGTFVCSCGRTFDKKQGLTRHVTSQGKGHTAVES
jgi:hypothetical protein